MVVYISPSGLHNNCNPKGLYLYLHAFPPTFIVLIVERGQEMMTGMG